MFLVGLPPGVSEGDNMRTQSPLIPVEQALRRTELITACGIILACLENLSNPRAFDDDGLMSWQVGRTRFKWTADKRADILNKVMSPPGYQSVIALRMAAAAVVLSQESERRNKAVAYWILVLTNLLLSLRHNFGGDGSDHMNMVVSAALAIGSLFPGDARAKEACAWFVTGQSCLSYLASGVSKLTSTYWRNGEAMTGIFRTHTYGDKRLHQVLQKSPLLSKAGGWSVILGEITFPLVLLTPKKIALGILGTGVSFHLGNAVFMGLNRFVWAFSATYPSVAHCSRGLRQPRLLGPGGGR